MKGIYILTSPSGKQYVGKDNSLSYRANRHLSGDTPECRAIHNAINYYGAKRFTVETIEYPGISDEALSAVEQWKIRQLGTKAPNGYNLTDGGDGTSGHRHSPETKRQMSNNHVGFQGKKHTFKSKMQMSKVRKGKGKSPETRRKIGEWHKGKSVSLESRRLMSERNWQRRKRLKAEWVWVRSVAMLLYESRYPIQLNLFS